MAQRTDTPVSGEEPLLPDVLFRLSGILEMLHSTGIALQNSLGEFGHKDALRASDIETLQSLDFMTQAQADLARFIAQLASEAPALRLRPHGLEAALTLGQLRSALLDAETETAEKRTEDMTLL